jgi:hypothetical protein
MALEIDSGRDFGRFWEEKWKQVGTKMESKLDHISKMPQSKKCL